MSETWEPADRELVSGAEEVYTSERHGGVWYVALVNDFMHRYVLILDGRVKAWPLAAGSAPMERVFRTADRGVEAHRGAVARLPRGKQ